MSPATATDAATDAAARVTPGATPATATGAVRPAPVGGARVGRGFLAALVVASVLNPLNTSSLATALPSLARELHADAAATGLVVAVVYVASSVAQPVLGALTARVDARRVLLAGLAGVVLAGVVGGTATSVLQVLVARVLVGIGTSAAVPASLVLLRRRAETIGAGTPTRELAALSAAGNVVAAAGLPIGGLLVSTFGWRSVLAINAPAALVALALVLRLVPRPPRGTAVGAVPAPRPDLVGVGLFTASVVALARVLDAPGPGGLAVTVAAVAALVAWEWRLGGSPARAPFLDVRLVARSAGLRGVYLRSFWLSSAVYASLYGVAQWLGVVHGLDASVVGLLMLPQSVLAAVAAVAAGRVPLVRALVLAGGVLLAAGGAALALAGVLGAGATRATPVLLAAVLATALVGAAFGAGTVGNQAALYVASTGEQFGVASGLLRTASYVGGFVSTALLGVVFGAGVSDRALVVVAAGIAASGLVTLALGGARRVPRTV